MQHKRSWRDYLTLAGKGMMMGAADAVPGVSGGTIAFMTGIYEELIHSIRRCGPEALGMLFTQGLRPTWQHINGTFLVTLLSGILISLLTLAHVMLAWLDTYPVQLWSFFFGLIVATVFFIGRQIPGWNLARLAVFLAGCGIAYGITLITPTQAEATPIMTFAAGMLAICAMILPGISGSFILLLLGMYSAILLAVKTADLMILGIFAGGCIIGLLLFSRILSWMFAHHKVMTLAMLTGFMLGSLNKVWPWKVTIETTIDRHGEVIPLIQENVLPGYYQATLDQPSNLSIAIVLMFVGAALVWLMERLALTKPEPQEML